MQSVPAGYTLRRPTLDDGPNTYAVIAAHNVPLIGEADFTLEDAIDQLKQPDFDLAEDGWLVFGGAGEPVGWARAGLKGKSNNGEFEAYTAPGHEELAAWLWETAQSRAIQLARAAGHQEIVLDTVAGYLLRDAFAADAALGRAGTVLDVDSNPERPALGLYQRAGMRQIMTIDDWRKLTDI